MSSRREEERNEKIIRGLMKLPPNRRCINCNSMGPQYVCINFWTFVCTTCSGIHREFTHRVKSVSMTKFTSQEVDSLQNSGNQRARELYLKTWDLQRQRLPDNSNVDKVREFIKNVYVNKMYVMEKSSDRPPRDPQGLSNLEDETRRASSYHSYSQSPPYDFQYEERRYGKHAPALSRKPGSDVDIYEGKLSSFFSPSRFIDHANDDRFANDGSNPRPSDYSVSRGWDPFGSDILSPSSQRDTGSPFRESSRGTLSEVPRNRAVLLSSDSDKRNGVEGMLHSQRTASLESFGSFDSNSMSFKSVNSTGLPEVSSKPESSAVISQDKSSSVPPPVQSSTSANFDGLDLFAAPFAPQNFTSVPPTSSNSQLPQTSLTQSVDFFQQYPVSSVSAFTEQQPPKSPQPSLSELFPPLPPQQLTASFQGKISDGIIPDNGGWATFDMAQNFVPLGTEESSSVAVPASDRNTSENFNPFSFDQNSCSSASHEPAVSSNTFWQDSVQNVGNITKSTPFWNAFENSSEQQPVPDVLKSNEQAFDADTSLGFGAPESEVFNNDRNLRVPHESETPLPSSSSHFSIPLHVYSMVSEVAGLHSVVPGQKPSNPFDLPYDTDTESGNMSQFWDMSSLQSALPSTQKSASYAVDANQSWFPQNSIPSHVPGGVTFDFPSGSLGLIAGQTPNTHISNIPAQAPVGGNPFA